jgi:hypothetical protein
VTAGVTYDSFTDVPTLNSSTSANYAVGNPLAVNVTTNSSATLTNGNLYLNNASANYSGFPSTMSIPITGKWAWKFKVTGTVGGSNDGYIGFACNSSGNPVTGASSGAAANWYTTVQVQAISDRGVVHKYAGGSVVTDAAGSGGTGATGDEWEFLIDRDAGTTIVKVNGTTKATVTGLPATQELFPFATFYQTGGYFFFNYTPSDTSYNPLNTQNLPTPTISNGAQYMAASLYSGTSASQSIVNSGNNTGAISFKPDLVWIKSRSAATDHKLTDSVRGVTKALISDTTGAETTDANGLTAFNTNGFTVGSDSVYNNGTGPATYVAWQWQAGAGSTSSNTSGSITSTVSANPTAGFSVVTYTGTGANATVGHGLGVAPKMIIVKRRNIAPSNWVVWQTALANTEYLLLNNTAAKATLATVWNSTSPTSSVFSVGTDNDTNGSTNTIVAYCFSEVSGYSKFGSYTGNGSTDGPFVYLGFRPRFVLFKTITDGTTSWLIMDSSRSVYNLQGANLFPNSANAENTTGIVDFLSNGFKPRINDLSVNGSGGTYIFAAFAENPFKNSLAR